MNTILNEPIAEPKVKITVEGGVVIDVESEIHLSVQIVDIDAQNRGDNWASEFIAVPIKVVFDAEDGYGHR